MQCDIIHILPFDIGISFHAGTSKISAENFIKELSKSISKRNYEIVKQENKKILAVYKIDKNIECHITSIGIGVFIIKNLRLKEQSDLLKKIQSSEFCVETYFLRKSQQLALLGISGNLKKPEVLIRMQNFMKLVWEIAEGKKRPVSSNFDYKYNGLSYVFSIYHFRTDKKINDLIQNERFNRNINSLLNPILFKDILDISEWNNIEKMVLRSSTKPCENLIWGDTLIAASWSGILIFEEYNKQSIIDEIISLQIEVQSSWLIYDCIIDNINIRKNNLTLIQEYINIVECVEIDMIDANFTTAQKNIVHLFINTSNIIFARDKAKRILYGRIKLMKAKYQESQKKYSIISEILLLSITIFSSYEPLKSIFNSTFNSNGGIILIILLILYLIVVYMIIRRDR